MPELNKAYNIIFNIVEKKLDSSFDDKDLLKKKCAKYAKKIKKAGYKILMDKYNIATKKELANADSLHSEYCALFENAGLAILETNVLNRIRRGEVGPEILFVATLDQLKPDANKEIHDDINIRSNIKIEQKTSKLYHCKCGSNETIVTSKQTAGADEPPCVTACCIKCQRKWVTGF